MKSKKARSAAMNVQTKMRFLWHFTVLMLLSSSIVLIGCDKGEDTSESSGLNGKISIAGSSTIAPMISEIAKRFEELHPDVRIEVQTGGSSRGIRDTQKGIVDLGMTSRDLTPEESAELQSTTIGWDGIAFVVNSENSVEQLSNDQLVSIYIGRTENWQEVGGADRPIVVSSRAEGRSELDLVCKYLNLDKSKIDADLIDGETQQSIKTITGNINAITFTSIGAAQYAAESGESIKLIPLDGVEACAATVQSGEFELARPLILIRQRNSSDELVEAFVTFALSPEMDDITTGLGYVPINRDTASVSQN